MNKKNAISYMLATKRAVDSKRAGLPQVRATGPIVRSTRVLITERRDVPAVYAVKRK